MQKILIFKTDRIGDLINISPVLFNLRKNSENCQITLVCSKYNSSVAKYYNFLHEVIIYKKPFFLFLISNFASLFFCKYDLVLQLDGKKYSYFLSFLVRSKKKACIRYIKIKKILNFKFIIKRPNCITSFFFNHLEDCIEDYDNINNNLFHYLSLNLKILKNFNLKIFSNDHYLPYKPTTNNYFNDYILVHIDERWTLFNDKFYQHFEKQIIKISKFKNIIITCNLESNPYFEILNKINLNNKNIIFLKKTTVDELINIIYYSNTVISSHTGFIVHVAASFKKKIIDIVSPKIFNELDRWIPFNIDYKRYDFDSFSSKNFKS